MKFESEKVNEEIAKKVDAEGIDNQLSDEELHKVTGGVCSQPLTPTNLIHN